MSLQAGARESRGPTQTFATQRGTFGRRSSLCCLLGSLLSIGSVVTNCLAAFPALAKGIAAMAAGRMRASGLARVKGRARNDYRHLWDVVNLEPAIIGKSSGKRRRVSEPCRSNQIHETNR